VIVTVGSVRGSPGVTSWSLLLAAGWPATLGGERVAVEADPDGGVLGARYGLGVEPGVVSLLVGLRRSSGPVEVVSHGRQVGGVWLVPGPETGEQARTVWASSAAGAAERFAGDDRLWVIDAGRLHSSNPAVVFVERSVITVLVSGARSEDLVQLPARVAALSAVGRVGVLVVGRSGYPKEELVDFLGTGLVWSVDANRELPQLAGQLLAPGRARRSWLWRQAVDTAAAIAAAVTVPAEGEAVIAP
jgi:MinD-like ATPase involved in chromosome partitioning or flagellar assembly